MAERFVLNESFIYIDFLLVIDSLFDFISFRAIAVLLARLHLCITLFSLHDS